MAKIKKKKLLTSPLPHVLDFDICGIPQNLNMEWPTALAMNCTVVGFVFLYRRLYILNLDFCRALIKNVVLQTREFFLYQFVTHVRSMFLLLCSLIRPDNTKPFMSFSFPSTINSRLRRR